MNREIAFLLISILPFFSACSSRKPQTLPSKPEVVTIHETEKESIKDLGNGWFEVMGTAVIQNITPEEADEQAIYNACRTAVQYYSGVEIAEKTLDLQAAGKKKVLLDHFCSLSTQTTNGIIVERDILQKEIKTDGINLIAVVLLKVKVGRQEGKRDPYFTVTAMLNRDSFRLGEEIALTVQSARDCYITVLNICSNDTVYVLFPNRYRSDNFIKANEIFILPNENDRAMGLSFPVRLFEGKDEDVEMIKILTTKENISFPVSQVPSEYGTYEMALKQLLSRLVTIPRNEMEEVDIQYFVKK
jgi:hypothetical protein